MSSTCKARSHALTRAEECAGFRELNKSAADALAVAMFAFRVDVADARDFAISNRGLAFGGGGDANVAPILFSRCPLLMHSKLWGQQYTRARPRRV